MAHPQGVPGRDPGSAPPAGVEEHARPTAPAYRWPDYLAWLVVAAFVARIFARPGLYQWDFRIYYDAAGAFLAGLDPYDALARQSVSSQWVGLPFVYPPLTLHFFALLRAFPLPVALQVWLALKLVCVGGLFWLWRRTFVPLRADAATVAFFVLAFGATLFSDLASGNVSAFEQLALWAGLSALVAGRTAAFAGLVILASQFKLLPGSFLVLLLVAYPRPRWRAFVWASLAWVAALGLGAWLYPDGLTSFFGQAAALDERGGVNPASLAFFRDLAQHVMRLPRGVGDALYGVFVLEVLALSGHAWWCYRRRVATPDLRLATLFLCVVYVLVAPRFKNYSYIVLLAPTAWLVWGRRRAFALPLVAALAAFPLPSTFDQVSNLALFLQPYLPLVAAVVVWWSYRGELVDPASP